MRDYGKVHSTFWSSPTTAPLSDDAKLLALYLLTCTHSTIAGVFRLPDGYASEDLHWTVERVQQGLAELLSKGFANRCETTKWVWVVKHLTWNPPDNPNQRKAAAKVALSVPDECSWKRAFMRDCGESLGIEAPTWANPSETVPEPIRNQEQEQEQEQEQKNRPSVSSAKPTIPCPYESIVGLYHDKLPLLPRVKLMPDGRQRALRKLWGWVLSSSKPNGDRRATTAEEALAWFGDYFARAAGNDFLMGRGQRSDGHANWRCDIDFLLTEKGMRHVIEKTEVIAA